MRKDFETPPAVEKRNTPAVTAVRQNRKRLLAQSFFTLLSNAYLPGWLKGKIYSGALKQICVPGLNCYSCPSALGACPLGSLQNSIYDVNQFFPFYVLAFLFLSGSILARAVCGWLCPFGFFQDLLYKIPGKKFRPATRLPRLDRGMRQIKYVFLFLLVLFLPLLGRWVDELASPWFCKLICPAGTIFAGWPLVLLEPKLRHLLGILFSWKSLLAILLIAAPILISRFFCRYLCPLGAIYSFFNRYAFFKLRFQRDACVHCSACARVCPMEIAMPEKHVSGECIRCGRCAAICPTQALHCGFTAGNSRRIPCDRIHP